MPAPRLPGPQERSLRPELRLVRPDDPSLESTPPLDARATLTLLEAFENLKLPEIRDRSRETIGDYRTHCRRWMEFWGCGGTTPDPQDGIVNPVLFPPEETGEREPAVAEITRQHLVDFQAWLQQRTTRAGRPFGPRTVNKHLGSIKAILQCCQDHAILSAFPRLKPLPARRAAPKIYLTYEQLAKLFLGCRAARWPARDPETGCDAVDRWCAAIVWWFIYGGRTQEGAAYESDHESVTWSCIHDAHETPSLAGHARCEFGWQVTTPQKQRRYKGEPLILPIHRAWRYWLDIVRPPDPRPDASVLPFPRDKNRFYETWHSIVRAAGLATKRDPATGAAIPYQIKHLRKSSITWHNRCTPGIAPLISGHASERDAANMAPVSTIVADHYDNAEQQLVEHMARFPVPDVFYQRPNRLQKTLF